MRASTQRITVNPTTIDGHLFLGAECVVGSLEVYKGPVVSAGKKICEVASGTRFAPRFAIDSLDMNPGTVQARRSKITFAGSTDSIVHYVATEKAD